MQYHHVWKRHPPEVVEPDQRLAENDRKVAQLGTAELREARAGFARRDECLVGVAREIGNERKGPSAPHQETPSVRFLGGNKILK